MKRRHFLHSSALAAGGLWLSFQARGDQVVATRGRADGAAELGDFLSIAPDGTVLFRLIKHEMGQGVGTSMAQILCEELCADWRQLRLEFSIADVARFQTPAYGGYDTGGSNTIRWQYDVLRKAGATARQMLIGAAAKRWGVSSGQCRAEEHWVFHAPSSRRLSFGELASLAAELPVPTTVTLKPEQAFTVIGQSKPGKLLPQMVTGRLEYGMDVRMPGLHYALIARCPVFKGKLASFDSRAALKIKGVKAVVSTQPIAGPQFVSFIPHDIREGVAVVADSFWAAKRGRAALEIQWDEGANAQYDSEDFERWAAERAGRRMDPTGFIGDENAIADMARVKRTLHASYVYPHQLHSCMEPLNCTAHVRADRCEVWCGSQAPNLIVGELQKLLGLPASAIEVHLMPSGGGFGRRYYTDFAVEAAFISRQVGGLPVKMMWTRDDDQQHNLAHHYQHLHYQAALDEKNALHAWYEKEVRSYTWGAEFKSPELPQMAYDIPNIRYDFEDMVREELIQSSAWRGVVAHGKALSECFVDEIAAALEADPYEYRLSLLTPGRRVAVGGEYPISSDRLRSVLRLAAERARWGRKLEPGRGMGIALCPYGNTCSAAIAEVTVREGKLKIDRVTVVVDCGKVINPSGATNQLTGGIIWSLTALLYGGVPIRKGRAVHSNFHEGRLLRMSECPIIDVHLVPSKDVRPWGIGEVSAPLGVPAVLNAIFAATGKRIRRIPLARDAFEPSSS